MRAVRCTEIVGDLRIASNDQAARPRLGAALLGVTFPAMFLSLRRFPRGLAFPSFPSYLRGAFSTRAANEQRFFRGAGTGGRVRRAGGSLP